MMMLTWFLMLYLNCNDLQVTGVYKSYSLIYRTTGAKNIMYGHIMKDTWKYIAEMITQKIQAKYYKYMMIFIKKN